MQSKGKVVAAIVAAIVGVAVLGFAARRRSAPAPAPSAVPRAGAVRSQASPPPGASSAGTIVSDRAVWKVPVLADDPFKGRSDALVTIVSFSELESPFCKRAAATLDQLLAAYPNDLRVVWKDHPLPFDTRARPAALFGRAVYAAQGHDAFWRAHSLLLASPQLEAADLGRVAQQLGLSAELPKQALKDVSFARKLEESLTLGFDVQAKGIPHFFINGLRLAGAQPLEKLLPLVDQELAKAKALVSSGVAPSRLYETIVATGKQLPALERRRVPRADASSIGIGAPDAPVVVQFWSSFPCVACISGIEQLAALEREYQGRVRVVFRIASSSLAAEASREVFAQQGLTAFQAWYARFAQSEQLSAKQQRDTLDTLAEASRLDLPRFKAALDARRHQQAAQTDSSAAQDAGIAMPAFSINDYYLAGPQPTFALRRAVQHALNDAANAAR